MSEFIPDLSLFIQEKGIKIYKNINDVTEIIGDIIGQSNVHSNKRFCIIDLGKIVEQFVQWKTYLPRVKIFYAVKCNSDPVILRLLNLLDCNFDCASRGEINSILEMTGHDGSRIIYANPCKSDDEISYSRTVNVDTLTFDSEMELVKIKLLHTNANLILRIQVDDSKSVCKFNCKFGCEMNNVESLFKLAHVLKLNITGVSFHVGSGCKDASVFETAIRDARKAFDIGRSMGFDMKTLDIGGGFPGTNEDIRFEEIAKIVNNSLNTYFSEESEPDIEIIAEPGRYMVTTSHTLVLTVIGIKQIEGEKYAYTLNDGVYGSFNCIIFDHAKPVIQPFNESNERKYDSIIFGPTCDSMDKISDSVMLPKLCIGECCYVENFGAYTFAAASKFNGFELPRMIYVMTKQDEE